MHKKSKKRELKVDVLAIEKIAKRSPGIDLQRVAVQLGYGTRLNQKLRESLLAAIFRYPDRVRVCCDRFAASKTSRESLKRLTPGTKEYEKTLAAATGQVSIVLYPADHEHRLVPLDMAQSKEPKCKIWIDPSLRTWRPVEKALSHWR